MPADLAQVLQWLEYKGELYMLLKIKSSHLLKFDTKVKVMRQTASFYDLLVFNSLANIQEFLEVDNFSRLSRKQCFAEGK